jgi:hypothetical protein
MPQLGDGECNSAGEPMHVWAWPQVPDLPRLPEAAALTALPSAAAPPLPQQLGMWGGSQSGDTEAACSAVAG